MGRWVGITWISFPGALNCQDSFGLFPGYPPLFWTASNGSNSSQVVTGWVQVKRSQT
jgi:hypothetical protein